MQQRTERGEAAPASGDLRGADQPIATERAAVEAPWFEFGLATGLEFGRGVMVATVVSPSLTIRTWRGLRLGVSYTPTVGMTEGMEGCSTLEVCPVSRWRAMGRFEYQFDSGSLRPWLATDVGRETWTGTDMRNAGRRLSGARTMLSVQTGIDAVTRGSHSVYGVGLYGGFNVDEEQVGLALGLRVVIAPY